MQNRLKHFKQTSATMHQAVPLLAKPHVDAAGQCKTLCAFSKRLTCSPASGDISLSRSQTVNVSWQAQEVKRKSRYRSIILDPWDALRPSDGSTEGSVQGYPVVFGLASLSLCRFPRLKALGVYLNL